MQRIEHDIGSNSRKIDNIHILAKVYEDIYVDSIHVSCSIKGHKCTDCGFRGKSIIYASNPSFSLKLPHFPI